MMVPAWIWQVSAAGLIAVVVAEIVLTGRSGRGSFTVRSAVSWVAVYVSLAVIFGLAVGLTASWVTAGQFYAGYLTEYSLSLDNLFIFYVIISRFAVPADRQHRVLLLGIGAGHHELNGADSVRPYDAPIRSARPSHEPRPALPRVDEG